MDFRSQSKDNPNKEAKGSSLDVNCRYLNSMLGQKDLFNINFNEFWGFVNEKTRIWLKK